MKFLRRSLFDLTKMCTLASMTGVVAPSGCWITEGLRCLPAWTGHTASVKPSSDLKVLVRLDENVHARIYDGRRRSVRMLDHRGPPMSAGMDRTYSQCKAKFRSEGPCST